MRTSNGPLRFLTPFALLLGLIACPPSATTLFVLVRPGAAPEFDQLSFTVDSDAQPTLGPALRPETAGPPLEGEQSVRLLLPAGYTGTVTVKVDGLLQGITVATGTVQALVRAGSESSVVVDLNVANCTAANCPGGCCSTGPCRVGDLDYCGSSGGVCGACDRSISDRCEGGVCACGSGPACVSGQRCSNGTCVCDPSTCAGCCLGNACFVGTAPGACGSGGQACSVCGASDLCVSSACSGCTASCPTGCCNGGTCITTMTPTNCGPPGNACASCGLTGDSCANGACQCGSGPACATGKHCVGGACVCDSASCRTGCCPSDAGACEANSLSGCGTDGGACTACNVTRANLCTSGACRCGAAVQCVVGSFCDGGTCQCNPSSCPGCCAGGTCQAGTTAGSCGRDGGACTACVRQNTCTTGACRCGAGAPCGPTYLCVGGNCLCDSATCAGCCTDAGTICRAAPVFPNCFLDAGTCSFCDPLTADSCGAGGTCLCGGIAPCTGGLQCLGGVCTCTPATCPGCCSSAAVCAPGNVKANCGAGGVTCQNCNGAGAYCDAGFCAI